MSLVSTRSQAVVDSSWLVLEAEKEKFDDIKKVWGTSGDDKITNLPQDDSEENTGMF